MVAKKLQLKETTIFPMSCERGHNFQPIREDDGSVRGYYKEDDRENKVRNKVYSVLYCSQCGSTKEIVIVNKGRS